MGALEEEARKEMKGAGQRLRKVILAENPEMADDEILDACCYQLRSYLDEKRFYLTNWCGICYFY